MLSELRWSPLPLPGISGEVLRELCRGVQCAGYYEKTYFLINNKFMYTFFMLKHKSISSFLV